MNQHLFCPFIHSPFANDVHFWDTHKSQQNTNNNIYSLCTISMYRTRTFIFFYILYGMWMSWLFSIHSNQLVCLFCICVSVHIHACPTNSIHAIVLSLCTCLLNFSSAKNNHSGQMQVEPRPQLKKTTIGGYKEKEKTRRNPPLPPPTNSSSRKWLHPTRGRPAIFRTLWKRW